MAHQVSRKKAEVDPLAALLETDFEPTQAKSTLKEKKVVDIDAVPEATEDDNDLFGDKKKPQTKVARKKAIPADLFGDDDDGGLFGGKGSTNPGDLFGDMTISVPKAKFKETAPLTMPETHDIDFKSKAKANKAEDRAIRVSKMPGAVSTPTKKQTAPPPPPGDPPASSKKAVVDAKNQIAGDETVTSAAADSSLAESKLQAGFAPMPKSKDAQQEEEEEDDAPLFGEATEPTPVVRAASSQSKNVALFSADKDNDKLTEDRNFGEVFVPPEAVESRNEVTTNDTVDRSLLNVDSKDLEQFEAAVSAKGTHVEEVQGDLDDDLFNMTSADQGQQVTADFDFSAYINANESTQSGGGGLFD